MDKNMENKEELNREKLEEISGGAVDITHLRTSGYITCTHPDKYKTGAQREDTRWLAFSQHQFEYYCPKCKETFWVDEEP